ncbi:GTP-binding protein [Cohnella pontilimi]|uniref:GTP-binding protein n=1 Tax=Cohnella pontilimi TaxID=2564100 RepID=A0A4V5LSS2_9BACL|nr:GTP-binding protein [Cohnella pontilimi]TJY44179.1 GTP-binding protein [Cohnella pontilimi]
MTDRTIPVYVLTGFLGSGKTTLLRRLLDDAKSRGWKPAVLMNEVGEVNLDGIMVDASVPMAEMLGGCICCTIRGDLGVELTNLAKEHKPDVIWIESTGVAQPLEILDAVTEASMYGKLELRGVVTLVDARHLLDRLRIGSGKTFRLMQDQIRVASLVVLNKTDLVGEPEKAELQERIAEWNPAGNIVSTVNAELDPRIIYDEPAANFETGHPHGPHDHMESHPHHDHDHVHVFTHYLHGAMDSHAFERFLRELPEGVYRAKGIVTFRDTANRYLFQYAYRETDFLPIRPQKTVHDVAVFIGEDFSKADIGSKLEKLSGRTE